MEDIETLQARHRKEKKDLQGQITALKHSVTKGDKKRKKEVTDEIARMEKELTERHKREQNELESQKCDPENPATVTAVSSDEPAAESDSPPKPNKPSRAQKRREKKTEQARKQEQAAENDAEASKAGLKAQELNGITAKLKEMHLQVEEVPADGDCLYNAVSHQLLLHGHQTTCSALRESAATHMRSHPDDYLPFLTDQDGEPLGAADYDKYCDKVAGKHGPVWGGQPEICSLSEVLQRPIHVIQSNSEPIRVGEQYDSLPLILVYHRHAYRLGEHYNSTMPAVTKVKTTRSVPESTRAI